MKWNWSPDPEKSVIIDIETQSAVSIKGGSRAYLRHPTTRLMSLVAKRGRTCLVWAVAGRYPGRSLSISPSELWPEGIPRDGTAITLDDGAEVPQLLHEWIAAGHTFVAHNATGFDAEGLQRLAGLTPTAWYDTIPVCRASGLPGGLDALGRVFLGTGKDGGKDSLKLLYTAKVRNGEVVYPVGTAPLWRSMLRYNVKDVLLLDRVFTDTLGAGEPAVLDVNATINSRGVAFDLAFLSRLIDLWTELEGLAADEIKEITGGELHRENLRSVPQVRRWLQAQGVRTNTLRREVLERLYENPEEFFAEVEDMEERHAFVCQVLRLRQTLTRIGKAKLERILSMSDEDNRVRDVLVYCGAHTGRWSGRGFQPHNMARGVADLDVEGLLTKHAAGSLGIADVREAAAECKGSPSADDILSTILRPVFCAAFGNILLICDYAAIEGRGVAWVAGEEGLLEQFRNGHDIYCRMASVIFGRPITKADKVERQVGKVTVLGCGYSMSAPKFAAYCKSQRIDLSAAGTTAETCVEAYRDAHPAIAGVLNGRFRHKGVWQEYNRAARQAVERRRTYFAGRCHFTGDGQALYIRLPSGRELTYHNARIEPRVPPYAAAFGMSGEPKPTLVYDHHHGYEGTLYGGLITENIVQAICRDLLAEALVACEAEGLPVVLHVHDEIVCEVAEAEAEEKLGRLAKIMSTPPAWADGFPVAVEGFACPRYTKSPFKGAFHVAC